MLSSFSLKIRPILIPVSAIANNDVTIRYLIGPRRETTWVRKVKSLYNKFQAEYVETVACRASVREREERRVVGGAEKRKPRFYRIVGFAGKRFLYFLPFPSSDLFLLSFQLPRNNSIGKALLRPVYCTATTCYAGHGNNRQLQIPEGGTRPIFGYR